MAEYWKVDPNCGSPEQVVFVGNVRLDFITPQPDMSVADALRAFLRIDVIAAPGNELRPFQFVTLVLQIVAPTGALFVDHDGRTYHWDVLADPATTIHAFDLPDPDVMYWAEDYDHVAPTATLRIREDMTDLLSHGNDGRTYYVGISGITDGDALQFRALASACDVRLPGCELMIADLHAGEVLTGSLG